MRGFCVLLLLAVAFLADFSRTTAAVFCNESGGKKTIGGNELVVTRLVAAKRFLRSQTTEPIEKIGKDGDTEDEERANTLELSKFAELVLKAKGPKISIVDKAHLKLKTNPSKMFEALGLQKAGAKIEDNPAFIRWLRFIEAYRKEVGKDIAFADFQIMWVLDRKGLSDLDQVLLFEYAKQIPDLKSLAAKVQSSYFSDWIEKGVKPSRLRKYFDEMDPAIFKEVDPRPVITASYKKTYNDVNVLVKDRNGIYVDRREMR